MKLSALATAAAITVTGITGIAPAQANDCAGLSEEAEKQCWKDKFNAAGIVNDGKAHDFDANAGNIATNPDGCPAGQAMATLKGKPMGCMTPAQYELWAAQMKAAYRANRCPVIMPAPVAVPTVYNQHLQMQNQINHLQGCVQYGCGYR